MTSGDDPRSALRRGDAPGERDRLWRQQAAARDDASSVACRPGRLSSEADLGRGRVGDETRVDGNDRLPLSDKLGTMN